MFVVISVFEGTDGLTPLVVSQFLPVIGRLVKDRIEGTMEESIAARFSLSRNFVSHHGSRHGTVEVLEEEKLWGPEEFNAHMRRK